MKMNSLHWDAVEEDNIILSDHDDNDENKLVSLKYHSKRDFHFEWNSDVSWSRSEQTHDDEDLEDIIRSWNKNKSHVTNKQKNDFQIDWENETSWNRSTIKKHLDDASEGNRTEATCTMSSSLMSVWDEDKDENDDNGRNNIINSWLETNDQEEEEEKRPLEQRPRMLGPILRESFKAQSETRILGPLRESFVSKRNKREQKSLSLPDLGTALFMSRRQQEVVEDEIIILDTTVWKNFIWKHNKENRNRRGKKELQKEKARKRQSMIDDMYRQALGV